MAPAEGFAVWDRHPWFPGAGLSIEVMEPTEIKVLLRWHRTRLYDQAALLVDSGADLGELAPQIRTDYLTRRRGIGATLVPSDPGALPPPPSAKRGWTLDRELSADELKAFARITVCILAALYVIWRSPIAGGSLWSMFTAMWWVGLCALWFWGPRSFGSTSVSDSALPAATDRLRRGECGDCGYDLTGVSPGLPTALIGLNVGPRCCTECAAPWPLVPPAERATGVYPGPSPS